MAAENDDLISRQETIKSIIAILHDDIARPRGWLDPYYVIETIRKQPVAEVKETEDD